MTSVFPRAVMDQLAWRPRVPMTPLGPSGFPHDLERFRPVEREEVQVVPASRIEMPVMLRASPMDRGGLHTWLATREPELKQAAEPCLRGAADQCSRKHQGEAEARPLESLVRAGSEGTCGASKGARDTSCSC